MTTHRKTAIIVGVLYIIGTVTGVLSVVAMTPILSEPSYLALIAADGSRMIVGALLVLAMGLALALVPVVLYPLARTYSEPLALGYVVFRGALESVAYIAMVVLWLALVGVSRDAAQMGAADAAAARVAGAALLAAHGAANSVLVIVFCLGALMLYALLYQSRLVPRWLSVWGLVAILMHLATSFVALFTRADPMAPAMLALDLPIFLQEMVMAVWLIVRGFSPAASAPEPGAPGYGGRALAGRAGR